MTTTGTVRIDAFPESAFRYRHRSSIVCIDVISSCTTAVTAVAQGRRTFAAGDVAEAFRLAHSVPDALLAGEPSPEDGALRFDVARSPVALSRRSDRRSVVLLDPPGTRLVANCRGARHVYLACLRNLDAVVEHLAAEGEDVALLGAGEGVDFRCEDKLAAARIGAALVARGFRPEGHYTADTIERWGSADVSLLRWGRSAEYLRRTGRGDDLEFVLDHVADLDLVCGYRDGEIVAVGPAKEATALDQTRREGEGGDLMNGTLAGRAE
jgi:2-phosphosulfolactate phosphatase